MFYEILDENRRVLLPLFQPLKSRFYLAGGTGLALYLGHRDSADFDFFTAEPIDPEKLFTELTEIFSGHELVETLNEKDSLGLLIDGDVKVSFLRYAYPLVGDVREEPYLRIASIADIGCMKVSAIVSRSSMKDYVDLYSILQKMSLADLLAAVARKMPSLDRNLILKSIVYFDDVVLEPILYQPGHEVDFSVIKKFLVEQVLLST